MPGPEIPAETPGRYSNLCRPDEVRTCFGCCPPIRPAAYDHTDHRPALERQFQENARLVESRIDRPAVINGLSCWGLGFLDPDRTRVGCLLHPAHRAGRDLRGLTGYGDKCRRELCREAEIFARLPADQASLVLGPARGLDAFAYSSRSYNPVFRLLRWGPAVIAGLAALEPGGLTPESYRTRWSVLDRDLGPGRDGYAVETLLGRLSLAELARPEFLARYDRVWEDFIRKHRAVYHPPRDNRPFVHQLDVPPSLARFMRLVLGRPRASVSEGRRLRAEAEVLLAGL
ncbi:MAG: hypothetical protein KKB20_29650 [Proteobacteria bacterium]|nr:hypothetical protein [Pseudomonadota bacterium]